MKTRTLWKEIRKCFSKSKGRFISILCLVALGSFALVGLQVAGPDMRKTGETYFENLKLADLTVIGDYGIDSANMAAINRVSGAKTIAYGYLKDVVMAGSNTSIRVFSQTDGISEYELVEGRMPEGEDEIAIASFLSEDYAIGDVISFTEKEDIAGNTVLRQHSFRVVGFVNSSELLSIINMGQSTAGTGELQGYAVVPEEAFDSEVYMIARISFADTEGVDPYSAAYTQLIRTHKDELDELLADQPSERLEAIKAEYQEQIDEAKVEISDAKQALADAYEELTDGEEKLSDARKEYSDGLAAYHRGKTQAENQLKDAASQIAAAKKQLSDGEEELSAKREELQQAEDELAAARSALDAKWAEYQAATQIPGSEEQLAPVKAALEEKEAEYAAQKESIEAAKAQLAAAETELAQKQQEISDAEALAREKKAEADRKLADAKAELDSAAKEISEKEKELADGWEEYNREKPDAEQKIADGEEAVASAQRTLDRLKKPVYALDTRREIPGSEGYRIYGSVSDIIDSLANVFPIFLYFVAALVTLTTMTRFVDEERINSGTLKALGYENRDIIKKFTVYGLLAGMSGAVIGILLGHILLPKIAYNAYGKSFTYPEIELHFYPVISVVALALAFLCTVVPAFVVANRELKEKPAALLQPKPPEAGSQILLERITPIWNRMNFTHKVTARNIFRYKKRMLMTIFGVCGSVTLIFAGFSVQHSISGVKDRQFGEIMKYDLIVAENDDLEEDQTAEIEELLTSDAVKSQIPVYYETVSKTAGKNQDSQSIRLIVADDAEALSDYITLQDRATGEAVSLPDDGCVITERFAKLLGAEVGDTLEFSDERGEARSAVISGITEMYTGHFIFMNRAEYESVFSAQYVPNAHLVTLNDRASDNAKEQAGRFMELGGVKGVVQNTTLTNQIDTIVHSLNQIMKILILVAILLAVVILYNLTNINVSERMRELSTIKVLGFYDKEVTMYIYRETILLTVIGILVGYGLGDALYRYILAVVPPDDVMFNPALGSQAFVIPAVVIAAITLILGLMMNRRLRNVNMLEALKSVE